MLGVPRLGNCTERYGLETQLMPDTLQVVQGSLRATLTSAITVQVLNAATGLVQLTQGAVALAWAVNAKGLGWDLIWADGTVPDAQKVFQLLFLNDNPASATSPPFQGPVVPYPYAPYANLNVALLPYGATVTPPATPPVESYIALQTQVAMPTLFAPFETFATAGQILLSNSANVLRVAASTIPQLTTAAFLPLDWVFLTTYPPVAGDPACITPCVC
jgi:hypothetical protein